MTLPRQDLEINQTSTVTTVAENQAEITRLRQLVAEFQIERQTLIQQRTSLATRVVELGNIRRTQKKQLETLDELVDAQQDHIGTLTTELEFLDKKRVQLSALLEESHPRITLSDIKKTQQEYVKRIKSLEIQRDTLRDKIFTTFAKKDHSPTESKLVSESAPDSISNFTNQ